MATERAAQFQFSGDGVKLAEAGRFASVLVDEEGFVRFVDSDGVGLYTRDADGNPVAVPAPTTRSTLTYDPATGDVSWSTALDDLRRILELIHLVLLEAPSTAREQLLALTDQAVRLTR